MKRILTVSAIALAIMTMTAQAEVTISSQSYQKVVKKKKAKWVKATKVVPGTVVRYINTLKNKGKETAENLVVVNAVPEHMEYMNGTAVSSSKSNVTYSVDGGKTFAKPKKLYVKDKKTKKRRRAKASEYTTIKWVVAKLNSGKKTTVEYKAKLK